MDVEPKRLSKRHLPHERAFLLTKIQPSNTMSHKPMHSITRLLLIARRASSWRPNYDQLGRLQRPPTHRDARHQRLGGHSAEGDRLRMGALADTSGKLTNFLNGQQSPLTVKFTRNGSPNDFGTVTRPLPTNIPAAQFYGICDLSNDGIAVQPSRLFPQRN